jgi:hypothetical protein
MLQAVALCQRLGLLHISFVHVEQVGFVDFLVAKKGEIDTNPHQ